jgi:hypothetical protein
MAFNICKQVYVVARRDFVFGEKRFIIIAQNKLDCVLCLSHGWTNSAYDSGVAPTDADQDVATKRREETATFAEEWND